MGEGRPQAQRDQTSLALPRGEFAGQASAIPGGLECGKPESGQSLKHAGKSKLRLEIPEHELSQVFREAMAVMVE